MNESVKESRKTTLQSFLDEQSQQILTEKKLELTDLGKIMLARLYPDGSKLAFQDRGVIPTIITRVRGEALRILESQKAQSHDRIASIASSGNMPDWWIYQLPPEIYTKDIDTILNYLQANAETIKRTPRFIDTPEQVAKAKNAIRGHVRRVVEGLEQQGAKKITFSVCSAAAGFDMMLVSVLREMIENDKKDISIIITLPFDIESVKSYSISVGLQKEEYMKTFQWLLDNDAVKNVNGRVFFSEPRFPEYFTEHIGMGAPTVDQAHALSTLLNGNPNQPYTDVNNEIFRQALALSGPEGLSALIFDQGLFTNDLLGGARHLIAQAQRVGIPWNDGHDQRILVVQDGIISPNPYTPEIYDGLAQQYGAVLNQVDATQQKLYTAMQQLGIA